MLFLVPLFSNSNAEFVFPLTIQTYFWFTHYLYEKSLQNSKQLPFYCLIFSVSAPLAELSWGFLLLVLPRNSGAVAQGELSHMSSSVTCADSPLDWTSLFPGLLSSRSWESGPPCLQQSSKMRMGEATKQLED